MPHPGGTSPFPTQFTWPLPCANDGHFERLCKLEARMLTVEAVPPGSFVLTAAALAPFQGIVFDPPLGFAPQPALGFTPENVANKSNDGTMAANSATLYPSQQAAKTYADTKLSLTGGVLSGDLDIGVLVHLDSAAASTFGAGALSISPTGEQSFTTTTIAGLRLNNLTTAQRDAIAVPLAGMLVWNTTTAAVNQYTGAAWAAVGGGGGSPPFADGTAILMGSGDPTKLLRFEVEGFTAATTRVLTPQNASYTIAGLDIAQTFSAVQLLGTGIILDPDGSASFGSGVAVFNAAGILDFGVGAIVLDPMGNASFATGALVIDGGGVTTWGTGVTIDTNGTASFGTGAAVFDAAGILNLGPGGIILNPDGSASFASGAMLVSTSGQLSWASTTIAGLNLNILTTAQRDAAALGDGSLIFNTTTNTVDYFDGAVWAALGTGNGDALVANPLSQFAATTSAQLAATISNETGSGLLVFGTDPQFLTTMTLTRTAIGATPTEGFLITNTTAAAAGAQQASPAIRLTGQGWKTTVTAASQSTEWRIYVLPVQGSANPTSNLLFESSINGAAFANRITLGSSGGLTSSAFVTTSSGSFFAIGTRSRVASSADGLIELTNTAQTDFTRLNFGGTTSSFPGIARSGTSLLLQLADGTGNAGLTSGAHTIALAAALIIPSGSNTRAGNAVLVAGTVTVSNTTVTANSIVLLTRKTSGGTLGTAITYTLSAGASFTINSDSALDTSTFSYFIIENP